MKKIIIAVSVVVVLVLAYNMMGDEGSSVTETAESKGGIRSTLRNLLPGDKKEEVAQLGKHQESENVVVIKSEAQHVEVEDAIERIEILKDRKDHEALEFARWTLFSENAKYTAEEKERILEKAAEILNAEEVSMMSRDVLYVGNVPELYEPALNILTKNKSREETESLIKELLTVKAAPKMRATLIEFAATNNIYIR